MADEKRPRLTQDLELPPGVVVTPDHEVPEPRIVPGGVVFSDRVLTVHSDPAPVRVPQHVMPAQHDILSTYGGNEPGDGNIPPMPQQGSVEEADADEMATPAVEDVAQRRRRLARQSPEDKAAVPEEAR